MNTEPTDRAAQGAPEEPAPPSRREGSEAGREQSWYAERSEAIATRSAAIASRGNAVVRPMTIASLDGVLDLEGAVYPFPWTRGNFVDSLVAGYTAWTLNHVDGDLIGYCVAMPAVDEMHLLNITIAPTSRRRGHARRRLAELGRLCRLRQASRLWLEVRESNSHAREAYGRLGFAQVGRRRGYYPASQGRREDALVMSLDVAAEGALDALD